MIKIKNKLNKWHEYNELLDFVIHKSSNEKDIEAVFKAYIERIGWEQGKSYTRDTDKFKRYKFGNNKKGSSSGKPDYIFYDTNDNIVAICDVKNSDININKSIQDSIGYIEYINDKNNLNINIAIGFNGVDLVIEILNNQKWERAFIDTNEIKQIPDQNLMEFLSYSNNSIDIVNEEKSIDKDLLRNFFKKCDEIIRHSNIGSSTTEKFIELSSIIFLKMFSIKEYDKKYMKLKASQSIWELTQNGRADIINGDFVKWLDMEYKNLFPNKSTISLINLESDKLIEISKLVDKLYDTYELTDFTNLKGDILEFFQMESKDRKIGEFFTPRHIIRLMVQLTNPKAYKIDDEKIYIDKIYDPACGTGGFLIEVFNRYKEYYSNIIIDLNDLRNGVFHGTELKAKTALLAKLNMILIGDGHNNIINANAFYYKKYEKIVLKKDIFGHQIVIDENNVEFYLDSNTSQKIFHVKGDKTRKVTCEVNKKYWLFDDFGQLIKVDESEIAPKSKPTMTKDGYYVVIKEGQKYKKQNVKHFEIKNELEEDKIAYNYENVKSVNPKFKEEFIDGEENSLYQKDFGKFDVVLANQPFGLNEPPKADYLFIEHMLESVHDLNHITGRNGRIACIVANGFLYDPKFEEERKTIQSKYFIKAIISLPEKVFAPYVKTIKSNILLIEKRKPKENELTYFVKLQSDGLTQDDKRKPSNDNDILTLQKLWKSWEYTSELNSETGLDEEKPSHVQKDGFAEYYKLDYKNWTVNNYIKYKIPNFDYINVPLGNYISEEIVKIHPTDFVNSQEDEVQIYGVSKKYGLILSDINSAENFNQNYKILKNDCLVYNPARINIGSIAIYKNHLEDALISPSYIIFKINSPDLLPEYVYYFLKSKFGKKQIDDYNFGSVRNSLNFDDLKKIQIPFMPIEKQKSLLLLLENTTNSLNNLIDTFKSLNKIGLPDSLLYNNFNYLLFEKIALSDMIKEQKEPHYGLSKKSDDNGEIPILKMNDIFPYVNIEDSVDDIDKINLEDSEKNKYLISKNDILINRTNSYELVGKTGIYNSNIESVYASYIMKFTLINKYNPEYVSFFMNLASIKQKMRDEFAIQSNGQYNINFENLKKLEIDYPKNEEILNDYLNKFKTYYKSIEGLLTIHNTLQIEIDSYFENFLNANPRIQ